MNLNHSMKTLLLGIGMLVWMILPGCQPKSTVVSPEKAVAANLEFRHPLDPLDSNEIKSVKKILLDAGKIDTTYMFFLVNLQEPPKTEILAFQAGKPFRREAFAS